MAKRSGDLATSRWGPLASTLYLKERQRYAGFCACVCVCLYCTVCNRRLSLDVKNKQRKAVRINERLKPERLKLDQPLSSAVSELSGSFKVLFPVNSSVSQSVVECVNAMQLLLTFKKKKKNPLFSGPQSSSDLTCLVRFEKINVYTTRNYRQKFRAPTDFCFVLKVKNKKQKKKD